METTATPKEAVYTLIVPLDRERKNKATFYLKDMNEDVFLAARALMEKGKDFDAARLIIKSLKVGGDDVSVLANNFIASRSASGLLGELLAPVEGELKKN